MIDEIIIKKFVEVGKALGDDLPRARLLFDELKNNSDVNTCGPTECQNIANQITISDLCFLIKSIVVAESLYKWVGGSVASSIWLFRELQSKDYSKSINLADWLLPITTNSYVPFGSNNYDADTYLEYVQIIEKRAKQIQKHLIEIEGIEKRSSIEREKRNTQKKISASNRKSEERKELLEKLNKLSIFEQINILAQDDKYFIKFYPTSLADRCSKEVISTFSKDLQLKLLEKLKGKHKGPWGNFKKRLIETFYKDGYKIQMPWNRKPWDL